MRKLLHIALALMFAAACSTSGPDMKSEAPELLRAVPSDALVVGVFGHCSDATGRMLDSTSVLCRLDYGKFGKHRAAVALCDLGSITPILIIETGKATSGAGLRSATDTLQQTLAIAAQADSLKLFSAQLALNKHNILLLSTSATALTVVQRHLGAESSILDAPYFDGVLDAMGGSDAIAWRNRGAAKLLQLQLCGVSRKQLASFLRGSAEWTVANGNKLRTVQPQSEKYYCNFLGAIGEGDSKLGSSFPPESELIIDLPIADAKRWRQSYEALMDARVVLEDYNKHIMDLKKASGKSPLDWEKELGVQEVVWVAADNYSLNMVRCSKKGKSDGVQPNQARGYIRALYGEPFSPDDSCCIRIGKWLVSGPRAVLDTLTLGNNRNWPDKATAVVEASGRRLIWTKDNIISWQDSNR